MMNKEQKKNYITEMTAQFENSKAVMVTHYQGLTMPQLDELRSKMVVTENKKYSEDYLDPEKRSIANKLRVLFKDGSSTQEIEVEYPIGHRRRRNEGIPVLEKKFLSNLKTVFDDDKSEQIYKEFLDFDKLTSMSVVDFQKLLSL